MTIHVLLCCFIEFSILFVIVPDDGICVIVIFNLFSFLFRHSSDGGNCVILMFH